MSGAPNAGEDVAGLAWQHVAEAPEDASPKWGVDAVGYIHYSEAPGSRLVAFADWWMPCPDRSRPPAKRVYVEALPKHAPLPSRGDGA